MISNVNQKAFHREGEKKVKIQPYRINFTCSKCNYGLMLFTGESIFANPPINIHECNKCGHIERFTGVTYPRIQYEEVE